MRPVIERPAFLLLCALSSSCMLFMRDATPHPMHCGQGHNADTAAEPYFECFDELTDCRENTAALAADCVDAQTVRAYGFVEDTEAGKRQRWFQTRFACRLAHDEPLAKTVRARTPCEPR